MPGKTKLDRCVEDVMKKGNSKDSAYAICQASIKKGATVEKLDVKKGQEQTIEGVDGTTYTIKADGVYVTKKAKLGSGSRFKKVEEEAKESGAKDPAGVAAAAGRKKYGKNKFQEMAAAGKKHHAKKATVLKSLRTNGGAQDWAKIMKKYYPGALVMDNAALKSCYDDVDWEEPNIPALPHHVVIEEDIEPVLAVIKKGDIVSLIKAFIDKGYMTIDKFGPSFTDTWHNSVDEFMQQAISVALKSVDDGLEFYPEKLSTIAIEVFDNFASIFKSLEDAERLANEALPPEELFTGHELRPNKPISDEEVTHDQHVGADAHVPDANTEDTIDKPEPISQEAVLAQVHAHDHNAGKEVRGQPGKKVGGETVNVGSKGSTSTKSAEDVKKAIMSPSSAQGTDAPEKVDDHAARHAREIRDEKVDAKKVMTPDDLNAEVLSRPETQKEIESPLFKSLNEARAWENKLSATVRKSWYIVPTSFAEKKEYGRRYAYIAKAQSPHPKIGGFGNKLP